MLSGVLLSGVLLGEAELVLVASVSSPLPQATTAAAWLTASRARARRRGVLVFMTSPASFPPADTVWSEARAPGIAFSSPTLEGCT